MLLIPPITQIESALKLASNEGEKSSPKVSKLPLPISDSPLVIDLPDGQKIVVGKMTLGSVIEVATWRGVGRPDSRTSRLMLGMGSGNVNEDSDSGDSSQPQDRKSAPVKPKGFAGFIFTLRLFAKNFTRINWSKSFKALLGAISSKNNARKKLKSESTKPAPEANNPVTEIKQTASLSRASEDADIEEWLNKITQKASRESSPKKTPAKSAQSATPKAKATVKKAAPKPANARSPKKS
jgi:hypothetical protein